MLCQSCIEDLLKLIDRLDHIGERIKTEDVHQRQMELALKIHRLVSQKRTEYMKVRENLILITFFRSFKINAISGR